MRIPRMVPIQDINVFYRFPFYFFRSEPIFILHPCGFFANINANFMAFFVV